MDFSESIKAENQKLELETQKFREEKNLPGFWIPEKGENRFSVNEKEVRDKDFGEGVRKIFSVRVANQEKDWAVNPRNPIYKEIVKRLAGGQREFVLLRTGEGKLTRYEFLEKK